MTKRNGKKGQMRVVETILASFVIIFALSFVTIFAMTPTSSRYETTDLERMGYNVLHDLDKQGILARFVYYEEWDNLKAALRVTLPTDVYFNMTVLDLDRSKVNNVQIFYGDPETFVISEAVASVNYGLTGYPVKINATQYQADYNVRILDLQLVRG